MADTEHSTAAPAPSGTRLSSRPSFYVWVAIVLAVAVAVVILGWHSAGGTPDRPSGK
jgi:hypothetical protein